MLGVINISDYLEVKGDSIASKTLVDKEGGSITLFAFDKAQGLGEHLSPDVTCIQLIEGKAEVTIDEKTSLVREGEIITAPANTPFSIHAITKVKAVLFRVKSLQKN